MPLYLKPLTMIDPDGWQATDNDGMPVLNLNDPDCITLTVGAGAGTALPTLPTTTIYYLQSSESAVTFLRVASASGQLATATSFPVMANSGQFFRIGAGVTHAHAAAS